ncbi:efflux RND transporter periplasmic adaptor subunit [Acidihalobacter ferrooxydans]|uniref:Uncharacterized protein n=1 Tax=Acidihalobacter ferrooxydans TaxID=1765967 RepID=A0A1P8UH74_9GAMM|nr:efflux RND transporter periplasmic adaptor subunit [Acidihalobacter ferrooxydans]APZ43202.1 hypothetical protein BW247_08940 [Acidihalobacter ferrooxydans]
MLIFVIIVYGGVIGFNRFITGKFLSAMASMPPPAVGVSVAKAKAQTWAEKLQATASLSAEQGTMLTSQSSGTVTALHFESGQTVRKGTLLVQLNDNVARTQLASAQAKLLNAKQQMQRQRKLYAHQATSESNLQAAEASYREAQAAVQSAQATLANLQVRAPFNGHLGIRQVSLGQYVQPGTDIVDIQQWNPLRVDFSLPQGDLSRVAVGNTVELSVSGLPHAHFAGKVTALGSSVNNSTRTVSVQAKIDNSKDQLRPGMFGQVTLRLAQQRKVIAVPTIAITYSTYGSYVYVVKHTDKGRIAKQVIVKTGPTQGNYVDVTHGLKPGETVVIAGQVSLYPGAHVKIVPAPKGLLDTATATAGN